jgi:hypothetical protein
MYLARHKLKECTMIKNYMTTGTFVRGKKPKDDSTGNVVAPFPEEKEVISFYSGLVPHESRRKLKLIGRVINTVSPTVPEYLC